MREKFRVSETTIFDSPENKRTYNEDIFTTIAPKYNFVTRALSFGRDQSWKKYLMNMLPKIKTPRCLDIACGTADITFMLAKKYPQGEIIGADLTQNMLDEAEKKNRFSNVSFSKQDMCNLKFDDNSFDIITGGYALRNAPDLKVAIAEFSRVLKPGGHVAFLDFSKPKNSFMQKIQYSLLTFWGWLWGFVLHNKPEIYAYIPKSLKRYPDSENLKTIFSSLGFSEIKSRKMFFGFTEILICKKI